MKILIVEDEVLIREGMSDYLMECGYEVFEAGDGQEALDLFHRESARSCLAGYPAPYPQWPGSPQDHPQDQLSPCPHANGLP